MMIRIRGYRSYSLKTRIAGAIFTLVAVQGLILVCCIALTGTIRKIDTATYVNFTNQFNSRTTELQNLLNTNRKNLTNTALQLSAAVDGLITEADSIEDLFSDDDTNTELLTLCLDELVEFTRYNSVSGVFVIIDRPDDVLNTERVYRTSMYIRNSAPGISNGKNSNLLLEYGRVDIARQRSIAVNYLWTRDINFSSGHSRDFYFNPLNAAISNGAENGIQACGYWSAPFLLKKDDTPIITYSLPLMLSDGTLYGVIGLELNTTYISNLMPASEIPYERGFYLLGYDDGMGFSSENITSSGAFAKQFLSGGNFKLDFELIYEYKDGTVYKIDNRNKSHVEIVGSYNRIEMYETYSPFYNEQWAMLCLAPSDSVMYGSNSIKSAITISIISTIIFALILSVVVTYYIFKPIRVLSEKVRNINPEKPIRFEKSDIHEIDELSGAFEVLSDKVFTAAARMFKIIELVDMPLGSFEIIYDEDRVNLSKSLMRLMNQNMPGDGSIHISAAAWDNFIGMMKMESVTKTDEGITETLYVTNGITDTRKWLRVRQTRENTRAIGIMIDVTNEILQKQRLEFERNYDPLTKLLNRRAFLERAYELSRTKADTTGIMMFADLDDLKFVNDQHGHETGDSYIITFASFLNRFKELNAIVGRMSGDEFVIFMNGFNSVAEARDAFNGVFSGVSGLVINAADGSTIKLRVSVGISYYPDDSNDINELVKYADYAMYEIKHSIKGEIQEFNINSYNKNSFVINMTHILNLLIEEKRVRFALQPIVDVKTGEIYAYESLMRSMVREFRSPDEILKVARSQAKLYQIEKLTFDSVLSWVDNNLDKLADRKIFINSIPNQIFIESDMAEICGKYNHLFGRVVFEITENEFSNIENTKVKMDAFRDYGSKVAIDDYGSGYSNELALLYIEPEFLKIDMSIIRDIDKDTDKQQLIQSIIAYASKKNIKIVAEGVETLEELDKLICFGVDYVQGYYLAKPNFEVIDIPDTIKAQLVEISRRYNR